MIPRFAKRGFEASRLRDRLAAIPRTPPPMSFREVKRARLEAAGFNVTDDTATVSGEIDAVNLPQERYH
jgi:hypothetical protein